MRKVALLGVGRMGNLHLQNMKKLQEDGVAQLVAVCDKEEEKLNNKNIPNTAQKFISLNELLAYNEFEYVINATNSSEHFLTSKMIIEQNKRVLIEKPVVVSDEQVEELKRLVSQKNVQLSTGYTEYYNSVSDALEKLIEENSFNYMDVFRVGINEERNDKKDIDVIQDLLIHDLAVISKFVDFSKISEISGSLSGFNAKSGFFDTACVFLRFKDNKFIRFIVDRKNIIKIRKTYIYSNELFAVQDYMDQSIEVYKKGNLTAFGEKIWYSDSREYVKMRYVNNPLYDEIKDFLVSDSGITKTSNLWYPLTKLTELIRVTLLNMSNEDNRSRQILRDK